MPPIQTYERQQQVQDIGGTQHKPTTLSATTKLSGADPLGAALQQFGGQVQQSAGQLDQIQEKMTRVKDQGQADLAEVSRQEAINKAEMDFHEAQVGAGPKMSIEQKPQFMQDRMDTWEKGLREGWRGTSKSLEGVVSIHNKMTLKEQFGYQGDVRKFELEGAIVASEMALNNAVYNQDEMATARHFEHYSQIAGPQRAAKAMAESQTALAYDTLANKDSITGLQRAQEAMKDGSAWEGLDYVDEKTRSSVERANSRNMAKLNSDNRAIQRDVSLDAKLALTEQKLSYADLEVLNQQREDWDGPNDPSGIGKKDYLVLRNQLDAQLSKTAPKDAIALRTNFAADVAHDRYAVFGPNKFGKFESENDLETFKGNVLKLDSLSPDEKSNMFFIANATYKASANPTLSIPVSEAMSKLTEMEAKCIAFGIDVQLGENGVATLTKSGKDTTAEAFIANAEERYNILLPLYQKALGRDLTGRDTSAPTTLSTSDQEALDWANANPNSEFSAQIKQRLGVQ